MEVGGRGGCRPRCLSPDKRASLLFLITTVRKWCGVLVMLQAGRSGARVTAGVASLTIYRRMQKWLRGPELHREDVAYETSPEAAPPRDG
jgi:hypothetical protein